jgi:aromatic ring-opening dioxygenase LigB subunit
MGLTSAAIIPHGGIVRNPDVLLGQPSSFNLAQAYQDALDLQAAARACAEDVVASGVDTVLLITPHGMASDSDWGVYNGNHRASGKDSAGQPVEVTLDTALSNTLLAALRGASVPACGLSFGAEQGSAAWPDPAHALAGSREAMPIFWGEVNPLSFLLEACGARPAPSVVVLSLPTRQDGRQDSFGPECKQVAHVLSNWIGTCGSNVGLLISADLSHTHRSDAHLPGYTQGVGVQPFAISDDGAARVYDEAIGKWAASLDTRLLFETAAAVAKDAHCDNHLGFMVLHYLLTDYADGPRPRLLSNPAVHCLKAPMYFGMLTASFTVSSGRL